MLLLLAMFAIAARYEDDIAPPADPSIMWDVGDDHFNNAKMILDECYAMSRPSTCQALLLMGYREIGIGAMAQAWTYIGMAIRMAQDLGMHRCADKWARVDLGGKLFGERELNERKRIWYGCVIMDKYVSTYIGELLPGRGTVFPVPSSRSVKDKCSRSIGHTYVGRPLMIFDRDFDTLMPDETDVSGLYSMSLEA